MTVLEKSKEVITKYKDMTDEEIIKTDCPWNTMLCEVDKENRYDLCVKCWNEEYKA